MSRFRRLLALPLGAILALALVMPTVAAPKGTLQRYARDTWRSFVHMVDPNTGLPADNIAGDLQPRTRSKYTSPTNIGMYLWAALAARDLGFIGADEAVARISQTLTTLEGMERHEPSGQFWNWYSPQTGEKLTTWPQPPNDRVYPFASSVDNGWLASSLIMVANAVPELTDRAWDLASSMNFGCYYDSGANLIRGGFWLPGDAPDGGATGDYCGMGENVLYTGHHYGAFNTEPRMASYLGIAMGDIPAKHYFGGWRTFPDTCDWGWAETKPIGDWVTYTVEGTAISVFEGAYPYDDQRVVPTWGGSMFEALMVPLVVPEEEWGPTSWAVTHPLFVESQIEHSIEADYGYWGFSPSSDPEILNGYREYGVDAIGMEPNGYTSDVERRTVDAGFADDSGGYCDNPATPEFDPRVPQPMPTFGQGVVTPHAAFLALDFAPEATIANLANLAADFPGLYGRGGFKDAVNVETGKVADRYLSLDQGMILAALANELTDDQLQGYLATTLQPSLQPLMQMERFGAGRITP